MRLLLDELYSSEIASKLRDRGHDAVAVAETPDLVGLGDRELIEAAARGQRVILTNNVADFVPLAMTVEHFGMLFSSDRSMPRSRKTIGLFVRTLDRLMAQHPETDALRGRWLWIHW